MLLVSSSSSSHEVNCKETIFSRKFQSSMTTLRHSNLSLLSPEPELAESLDNDEITTLSNAKPRRLQVM